MYLLNYLLKHDFTFKITNSL